jgi:diguanylate cyclase (GGDEF)-like protein/PAS domain S-box-containing protein
MVGAALMGAACWLPRPAPAPVRERRRWPAVSRIAFAVTPLLVPGAIEIVGFVRGVDPDPVPLFVASVALCGLLVVRTVRIMRSGQEVETELRATEEHFEALVQRSSDAALVLEADGTIRYVSPAAIERFGYRADDLVGALGWDMIHPDDLAHAFMSFASVTDAPGAHASAELRVKDGKGGWRWVEEVVTNLLDEPAVQGLVANIRDISERKAAEQRLERIALYDELTGLPNRWRVSQVLDRAHAEGRGVALVVFGLDRFRFVNASRGRATGDRVLQAVADRLHATMPEGDMVGRLGSDVFAVVATDARHWSSPAQRARLVHDALRTPFEIAGQGRFHLTASAGLAFAAPGEPVDDLLLQAETAMYAAKARGVGTSVAYDDELRRAVDHRVLVEQELRRALRLGQLVVHYQPVVEVDSGRIEGVEALVRWRHPDRGLLLPGDFIPVAEESSLIDEIGAYVLRQACRDAVWWSRAGVDLSVAVNVSATQMSHEQLTDTVQQVLYETGLPPEQLVLEVTETALMAGVDWALANISALRAQGIHVALDDFGTGYSSLAYLKDVPADVVKIDRTFVDGVADSRVDHDIVEAVLQLARALGRTVVAEGVETEAQHAALRRLGCPLAQGFLWSPAVPAEDLLRLVEAEARTPTPT